MVELPTDARLEISRLDGDEVAHGAGEGAGEGDGDGATAWTLQRLVVALTIVAGAAITLWITRDVVGDDSHITFTYSRNLADGYGPVFNVGDRTLSTTTPLTAIVMAIPSVLGLDLQFIGILVSVTASLVIARLLFVNLRPLTGSAGALGAGLVAVLHPFATTTVSNEMLAYTAAALGALHFAARHQMVAAASIASVCALLRPDGLLVLAMVGLLVLLDGGMPRAGKIEAAGLWSTVRAPLAAVSLLLGPWIIFATWFYGSPVPVTLRTKQAQRDSGLGGGFFQMVRDRLALYTDDWFYWGAGILLVVGVGIIARDLAKRLRQRATHHAVGDNTQAWTLALFLAWNAGYAAAYTALGVTAYSWYAVPLLVALGIFTAAGISGVLSLASTLSGSIEVRRIVSVAALVAIAVPFLASARDFTELPTYRTALYPPTGDWIATNVRPDESVGTLEVGIIGYTAHRTIIDFAGLIQPDITEDADPSLGFDGLAVEAWTTYSPDWVAMLRPGIPTLTSDARFQEMCTPAATFEIDGVVEVMDIFDCRDED